MRGEALGDGLGEDFGDDFGVTFGDPFGDFPFLKLLSFDLALLEADWHANSSLLAVESLSLWRGEAVTAAAPSLS